MGVTTKIAAIACCTSMLMGCSSERTPLPATMKRVMVVGINPPDDDSSLRIGMRDVKTRAGYSDFLGHCPDWENRVKMGQRFMLRFERWRSAEGLEYDKPSRSDLHERLCGAVRNPADRWMNGLPPTEHRLIGEFP